MKVTYVDKKEFEPRRDIKGILEHMMRTQEAAKVELETVDDAIRFQRTVHASSSTVKLLKDGVKVKTQRTGNVVMIDLEKPVVTRSTGRVKKK